MATSLHHHVAVRVADVERGARFYVEALGGRRLTKPFELEGPEIEQLFGGESGLKVRICLLGFDEGGLELFQFLHPVHAPRPTDPPSGSIIHWGVRVESVRDALARIEAAGGSAVHPPLEWGGKEIVYCRDPDGNIFELVETPFSENVRLTLEVLPDAAPDA
jgi:catechol 2,3-dioxygenase-like lactoylglutathione lyase family enzyme